MNYSQSLSLRAICHGRFQLFNNKKQFKKKRSFSQVDCRKRFTGSWEMSFLCRGGVCTCTALHGAYLQVTVGVLLLLLLLLSFFFKKKQHSTCTEAENLAAAARVRARARLPALTLFPAACCLFPRQASATPVLLCLSGAPSRGRWGLA